MSSPLPETESERPLRGLTYDSSADRLRAACKFAGVVLLVSPLLPFEAVADRSVFVWEILGELHPAAAVAALLPALVGLLLLTASRWLERPSLLAFGSLLALATWSLVAKLGADAAAWDIASLPDSLNHRVEFATLTIALSGAALRLLSEPVAARAARAVAAAAVVAGVAFGVWPGDGEAPVRTCWRFAFALSELPDPRLVLGYGLILVIIVFPLLAAATAASLALAGYRKTALLGELVTLGLPGCLFLLAARNVLLTFGDLSVVVLSAMALVLAALLIVSARAIELAALWATGLADDSDREYGREPHKFMWGSVGLALALVVAVAVLARPVKKGIAWPLAATTEATEKLFAQLLPKWSLARAKWGLVARGRASAAELAESRAAANDVLRAARGVNPELAHAVAELVQRSTDLDLAGRRWFHLVEAVNEASRRSKLPYYLDPSVSVRGHGAEAERLFLLYPYRIEGVRPARADGSDYALLDVRQLGEARASHQRLGFSRDFQPFALVVLDEIEPYAQTLEAQAKQDPPSCADADEVAPAVFARCGALLRRLSPNTEALRRLVARHELQHQIDGPELNRSAAVLGALSGYEKGAIDEVNRELSAYLSEFVVGGVSPKLALVHILPFTGARPGSGLHFIGVLELAVMSKRDFAELGEPQIEAAFDELSALTDEALRERARKAHEELFGAELPDAELGH